jgi:hypothetical protein
MLSKKSRKERSTKVLNKANMPAPTRESNNRDKLRDLNIQHKEAALFVRLVV